MINKPAFAGSIKKGQLKLTARSASSVLFKALAASGPGVLAQNTLFSSQIHTGHVGVYKTDTFNPPSKASLEGISLDQSQPNMYNAFALQCPSEITITPFQMLSSQGVVP